MKVAITPVFSNLTYNTKNHRGLEAVYFKQLLEENGYEVELIGKKNKNTAELDFYIDYSSANWQDYDAVFIQLSTANFFGGVVGEHMFKALVALKFSRESYNHKKDNLLDTVAYIQGLNNYINEKQQ